MTGEGRPLSAVAESEPRSRVGRAGHVANHDVFIAGDTLHVSHAGSGRVWRHAVPNFGTALADLARQPGLRLGRACFPDDAEAIYCFDADDGNFGYALNLTDPALSEWGYAPFGDAAPPCDRCGGPVDAEAALDDALRVVCGTCAALAGHEARDASAAAVSAAHAANAWARPPLAS